jgi:polyhydroxybutyrate depolymerase
MFGLPVSADAFDTLKLDINGIERSARVFPGRNADSKPAPLILVFHGRGDTVRNFSRAIGLHEDWPEATVVYPSGLKVPNELNMRGWMGGTRVDDTNDDLLFVDRMLEELPKRYRVDPQRVYASGFSNGGRFTFVLMAKKPDAFAAFVAIGALSRDIEGATQPRPFMLLFGRGEPREFREVWAETVVALVKLNRGSGDKTEWAPEFTEYLAGDTGAPTIVSLYNAGHIWPYDGNRHIIRFLGSHRLNPDDTH